MSGRGRGRSATLPAWMTKGKATPAPRAAEAPASAPAPAPAPAPASSRGMPAGVGGSNLRQNNMNSSAGRGVAPPFGRGAPMSFGMVCRRIFCLIYYIETGSRNTKAICSILFPFLFFLYPFAFFCQTRHQHNTITFLTRL